MTPQRRSPSRALAALVPLLLVCLAAVSARAEVTGFEITSREAYGTFAGREYVRLIATVTGSLGLQEPIPDLAKADDDGDDRLEYMTQALLWVPADAARGNGSLLVDLANRGRPIAHALYNVPLGWPPEGEGPLPSDPKKPPVTTGYLEEQGFMIVAPAWELGHGIELPLFRGEDGRRRYVEGVGFAAVRDIALFLRNAPAGTGKRANPLAGMVKRTLAVGYSQTGRFLKSFLLHGFNAEGGRRAIDGMHLHAPHAGLLPIMTSGTGPESMANGTPSFANPELPGIHVPPFTYGEILAVARQRGEPLPRLFVTNTGNDYHALRASLARTGASGTTDAPLPPEVRIYDIAGGPHVIWPGRSGCAEPRGRMDWHPLLRALVARLDRWVRGEGDPPQSRLMPLEPAGNSPWVLGPPALARNATVQVPQSDRDGNDLGGVRMPDIAVPLGTHRNINSPLDDFLCTISGSWRPFVPRAEQKQFGDLRLSLEERYGDKAGYVARVEAAARELAAAGLLLERDVAPYVEAARRITELK